MLPFFGLVPTLLPCQWCLPTFLSLPSLHLSSSSPVHWMKSSHKALFFAVWTSQPTFNPQECKSLLLSYHVEDFPQFFSVPPKSLAIGWLPQLEIWLILCLSSDLPFLNFSVPKLDGRSWIICLNVTLSMKPSLVSLYINTPFTDPRSSVNGVLIPFSNNCWVSLTIWFIYRCFEMVRLLLGLIQSQTAACEMPTLYFHSLT